ncbi:MAG: leucine-rich repeat domain-containing protein [Bacteroidales bacterium]|nr:leucine-rich repeat domain-containing protein [Bacteroidales bacterium]
MRCFLLTLMLLFPLLGLSQSERWIYDGCKSISDYVILEKFVGRNAFDSCVNLRTVRFSQSVAEIGDYAFNNCPSLKTFIVDSRNENFCTIDGVLYSSDFKTIVCCPNARATNGFKIHEGVTTIASCAFLGCENLTEITIPDHVEVIGLSAFEKCVNLTSVYISANVREIQGCAFSTCYKLQKFEVDTNNKYFTSIDGVLYNHDKTRLISCPNRSEYTIPSSVKIIGEYAFQGCKSLTSVTIPNSVEIIEDGAFSDCDGLTSIDIPQSVREIRNAAF